MDTFLNIDRKQVNHLIYLPPVIDPVYVTTPSKIPPNLTTTGAGYSMFAPANGNPSNITTNTINAVTGNITTLNTDVGNISTLNALLGNISTLNTINGNIDNVNTNILSTGIAYINTVSSAVLNLDGNVLTTSGADLLLNGIPIATTSNISSITDWALYPAVSAVNFETVGGSGNGQLINVSTINGVPYVSAGGSVADWATYPALNDVDLNGSNIINLATIIGQAGTDVTIQASSGQSLLFKGVKDDGLAGQISIIPDGTIDFGNGGLNGQLVNISTINGTPYGSGGSGDTISGVDTFMTASGFGSGGFNTSAISGSGGLGGFVTLTANAGDAGVSGGNVVITANGGTAPGGVFGRIDVVANQGVSDPGTGAVTTGGYINIQANSGGVTSPTLTSRIDLNAGGLNLYAGIASPIASVEGYAFINALAGISLVAGSWTSAFQTLGTVYLYGEEGVVMGSDMYATDIFPVWNGLAPPANLSINGRTTVSGSAYVTINNVSTINFEAGQAGALTGVQSINGSSYPPSSGGVTSLNTLSGALSITSPDASLDINPTGTDVELTVNKNTAVVIVNPTASPEIIIPTSGSFYAVFPTSTNDTISFTMTGLPAGTTFTVKNVATTTDDLNIEFDDGSGSAPATGVNNPLFHHKVGGGGGGNPFNSVMALCYWDGASLAVY